MSFKKVIVSTVAAAAIATGAYADSTVSPIAGATDQTGDYLFFPSYFANSDGWETNVRVVNTNTTACVIAKVVIRDAALSDEVLDFAIFLTPGDVWEGTLHASGSDIVMTSSDDSIILGGKTGKEETKNLQLQNAANRVITSGYIEVAGVAKTSYIGNLADGTTAVNYKVAPVDKHSLYASFNKTATGLANYAVVTWTEAGADDLTGEAIISANNTNGQLAMSYVPTALEGATGGFVGTPTNVIGANTALTNITDIAPDTWIQEVENVLNKDGSYVINYGANENQFLSTFLTKKYRYNEGTARTIGEIFDYNAVTAGKTANYYMTYGATPRDMEENTPAGPTPDETSGKVPDTVIPNTCNRELCIAKVNDDTDYADGYVTYNVDGNATTVMPYAAQVMTVNTIGGTNVTNIITPASY